MLSLLLRSKLGRCPRCMGLSLGLSLLFWALFLGSLQVAGVHALHLVLFGGSAIFTTLFIFHVVALTFRLLHAPRTLCAACGTPSHSTLPRRQALRVIANGVAAAVALSALNLPFAAKVFAQKNVCGDHESEPLHITQPICIGAGEKVKESMAKVEAAAWQWVSQNTAAIEAAATQLCQAAPCRQGRCRLVHYEVQVSVVVTVPPKRPHCIAGTVHVVAMCRCVDNASCADTALVPPVRVTGRACRPGRLNELTKEVKEQLCKQASEEFEKLLKKAEGGIGTRVCKERSCEPLPRTCVGSTFEHTRPTAKLSEQLVFLPELGGLGYITCCEVSAALQKVGCSCQGRE